MKCKRAFTLVELVVVVAIVGVLLAVRVGTLDHDRKQASVRADVANLRLIAQASSIYAAENADRLFTFSWRPGEVPVTPNADLAIACANLSPNSPTADLRAGTLQQLDLVARSIDSVWLAPVPSNAAQNHIPHVLYSHLPLQFYMGESFPSEVFISKADAARNYWMKDLNGYLKNPRNSFFRPPSTSTNFVSLWRWAFSSSYMTGPSHYAPDFGPPQTVARMGTHRQWTTTREPGLLGRRAANEVAHPSAKVMMFDDMDRYTGQGQFGMLPGSRSTMNFYDGHAGRFATDQADYGFAPNNPASGADTPDQPSALYFYSPISWWDPPGSVRTRVAARYDQTRDGLQGIDYSPGSVRRPIRAQFGR